MWLLEQVGEAFLLRSAVTNLVMHCTKASPITPTYGECGVALHIDGVEELFPPAGGTDAKTDKMPSWITSQENGVQDPVDELGAGVFTALRFGLNNGLVIIAHNGKYNGHSISSILRSIEDG